MDGSYTVIADKDVAINTLIIGSGSSNIRLTIGTGISYNVSGLAIILCPSVTILGNLIVDTLQWSGKYLDGSTNIGSSLTNGQLTISSLLVVERGLYRQKYLRDVTVKNKNNLTIDTSMNSNDCYLYCQYCTVINEKNATFLSNKVRMNLNGRPSQSDGDGFGAGIINQGHLIITSSRSSSSRSSSYRYWYWDIRNSGTVKVLSGYYGTSSYVYFYNRIINNGLFQVYMSYVYFQSNSWLQPSNGSWEIYGFPFRYQNAPRPQGEGYQWQWKEYLRDVYQNKSADLWDPNYIPSIYLRYMTSGRDLHFNKLTMFGRVLFRTNSIRATTIYFSSGFRLGKLGEMQLQRYSSSSNNNNDNNKLVIGKSGSGDFDVNLATIGSGWSVEIGSGSRVTTYRRLVVQEGAQFIVQPGPGHVNFMKYVVVKSTGTLTVSGRTKTTINGIMSIQGMLNISNSNVKVTTTGELQFTHGSIVGQPAHLYIHKHATINGDFGKTIDGVTVHVEKSNEITSCVIAEYFQYRLNTDLTSRINSVYYFPGTGSSSYSLPPEFDDPATEPNTVQFLDSLDRTNEQYGSSPIAVTSTFDWFDTSSVSSFTYRYAFRLWTLLQIDDQGSYTFFIDSAHGMRVRLWLNDKVVFTGNRGRHLISGKEKAGSFTLQTGLHRLRLDVIQESSFWRRENALIVTYTGPSFSERQLSQNKLFLSRTFRNASKQYANPKFNTSKFLPSESVLKVAGKGFLFAKNGASLIIGKTGVLEVIDDITWFSHSPFGSKFNVINSGKVIKTGHGGVATFFANYTHNGGALISKYGFLEFKDAAKESQSVLWNNPAGGSWFDANNWLPPKVPSSTDVVRITLEGTFPVIIPGHKNVTILSLTLGFPSSFPELVVGHFAKLTVTDRLDLYAKVMTINGIVLAQYVSWAGEKIRGSTFAGEIIAKGNFVIVKGAYNSKYLSHVNITAWNGLTIDISLDNHNNYLYCDNCFLINESPSTMLANMMQWSVQSEGSTMSNEFHIGLINRGLFVYELHHCCSARFYWDILNYGEIKIVNKGYRNSYTFFMYGTFINNNLTQVYAANLQFQNSRSFPQTSNGTWIMYGQPVRYQNAPPPVGQNQPGSWKEFLADFYQNASDPTTALWDPRYKISIFIRYAYFSSSSPGVYSFNKLVTYGAVNFRTDRCRYVKLCFNQGLYMGEQGKLNVQQSSPDASWNVLEVGDNAGMTVGDAYIHNGWNVTIGKRSHATVYRYITVYENGSLISYKDSVLTFHDYVIGHLSSVFDFAGSTVTCFSNFFSNGVVEIGTGILKIYGVWSMSKGQVTGSGGTIYLLGGWNITSDYDKTLKSVNVVLELPTDYFQTRNGIIAEYFQYRVDTDRTSRLSSLTNFLQIAYFDTLAAIPNVERIEPTIQHFPKQYGTGPLYVPPTGGNPDINDPRSFTYYYAARLWTFLRVDASGNYTFHFVPGYSLKLRLWIDDHLKEAGTKQFLPFPSLISSGPYHLTIGYHKIRLDYLVASGWWSSTGSTLLVYYSGPGFKKQLIPSNRLFYHDGSNYVKPSYSVAITNIASISGDGIILAQNAVNVTICRKCEFRVLEDILWYSDKEFGGVTKFINFGLFVRTGMPGTAVIYGKYVATTQSSRKTETGFLEFKDAKEAGGLAIWVNPEGGAWTDPKNWNPNRVPRSEDTVHITQTGRYQVIIPSYAIVNVTSVLLGSRLSSAELVILPFSKVYIQDRIGVHTQHLTLQGLLKTNKMTWTGQYIAGSNKFPGILTVDSAMVIAKGSYSAKHLQYVTIRSNGNFTVDSAFHSNTDELYCINCLICNYGTILLSGASWHQTFSLNSPRPDSFKYGIANYGDAVAELQTQPSYNSYFYFYWDILNYGNWSVICKSLSSSSCTFKQHSLITNYGRLRFYMTSIHIENSGMSVQLLQTNGTWEMFGKPYRDNNLEQPPGYQKQGDWQEYIDHVYKNISMGVWNVDYQYRLYLNTLHNVKLYFNDFRAYGRILIQSYQCRQTELYFDTRLDLGFQTDLNLRKYSSSTDGNHLICGSNSIVTWRQNTLEQGWSVNVGESSSLTSSGRILINGGASLKVSTGSSVFLKESLVSLVGSELQLVGSQVVVTDWTHKGRALLDSSTVEVRGNLEWEQGSLSSTKSSLLKIQRSCSIYGNLLKTLSGLDVSVESLKQGEMLGIVAEYFQYRVSTSTTTRLNGLYYFPGETSSTSSYVLPTNFDTPSTKANVMRIESSLKRVPQYYGNAPLAYLSDSVSYDSNSAKSFTYRYAARLWTYLKIDKSGQYTFYFQTGYGMRLRLWIDDKKYIRTRQYLYFSREEESSEITLQAGYHKLRIDYMQKSSYWTSRGGIMLVSYKGPGISKQTIPDNKLFAVRVINGRPTAAAVNLKLLTNTNVCKSSLSLSSLLDDYSASVSHMSIEGKGELLTENGVNITIGKSGILELKTDTDWPRALGQHTKLKIEGMVAKSNGTGKINLNTEFEILSSTGCLKAISGTLELGITKSKFVFKSCVKEHES